MNRNKRPRNRKNIPLLDIFTKSELTKAWKSEFTNAEIQLFIGLNTVRTIRTLDSIIRNLIQAGLIENRQPGALLAAMEYVAAIAEKGVDYVLNQEERTTLRQYLYLAREYFEVTSIQSIYEGFPVYRHFRDTFPIYPKEA